MKNEARGRADGKTAWLWNRVRKCHEFNVKGRNRNAPTKRHLGDGQLHVTAAIFGLLRPHHTGGKRRRVDLAAKLRPQIQHRADVIFMRMRQHKADESVLLGNDEPQIRQHDVSTGLSFAWKGDAKVNHQPLTRVRWPEAVEVHVHANFAEATQRHEDEFIAARLASFGFAGLLTRLIGGHPSSLVSAAAASITSPNVIVSRFPSTSATRAPVSFNPWYVPCT